jgi:hypothetical protein
MSRRNRGRTLFSRCYLIVIETFCVFLFAESEASWEEWWTYDGISGE